MPQYNITQSTSDQLVVAFDALVEQVIATLTYIDGVAGTTDQSVIVANAAYTALKTAINNAVDGSVY
jgi:hypothetical protein